MFAALQDYLAGRTSTYEIEHRLRHKTGKWLWILSRAKVFVRDEQGRGIRMMGTIRDITRRKEAEEELKRFELERAALQQRVISAQRAALKELSTPLLPIAEDVVVMPLIGTIDSHRAQQFMETLLDGVGANRARTVIVDVTGVQIVDTQVASSLVNASRAVRLLGAEVVLTGIRPEVARTLVSMGADLGDIVILGSLRSGIAHALRRGGAAR